MLPGMPNESYFIIGVKGSEVRFGSMHLPESNNSMGEWKSLTHGGIDTRKIWTVGVLTLLVWVYVMERERCLEENGYGWWSMEGSEDDFPHDLYSTPSLPLVCQWSEWEPANIPTYPKSRAPWRSESYFYCNSWRLVLAVAVEKKLINRVTAPRCIIKARS